MAQSTIYIATPKDVQRFEWQDPAEVQKTLEKEGFDFKDVSISHFLLHHKRGAELKTLIFSKALCAGQRDNGTTETLPELIFRYRPGPGLFFRPSYVALVQEDLYKSAKDEFKRLNWNVERIVNTN